MEGISPLEREHSLCVVLPEGMKKNITVHGSKPVMDLLVTLCANYHLNPSDYTVEFLSPNKNNISFKPNSPIGSLEAEKILLKPKGTEGKTKKPYMPEATVRLLINYNKSHKTVLRVNPRLPLEALLPAVCDKCEFSVETTILLRDPQSTEPLDLTKSLNDHGLREVFAQDMGAPNSMDCQNKMTEGDSQRMDKKQNKRSFFSFFRRRRKKNKMNGTVSAPTSPGLGKQARVRENSESISSTNTLPADLLKKRPAPPPPVAVSQSVPNRLSTCCVQGAQSSAESTLRGTKRRAPPPPCATENERKVGTDAEESLKDLEELRETDHSQPELSFSPSSPSQTHPQEVPDSYHPLFRGKDLSDARSALAKVLTSSVSKGTLVRRLRNSGAFPNFHVSSCISTTSKCADDGDISTEHQLVFRSNLPTENKWEDPVNRSGLTTFKMVPSKKPDSSDPEMTGQDQNSADGVSEVLPEKEPNSPSRLESRTRINSSEMDGNEVCNVVSPNDSQDCSELPLLNDEASEKRQEEEEPKVSSDGVSPDLLDGCGGEMNSDTQKENPREFVQSPDANMVPCSTEKKPEGLSNEDDEEEAAFPPPPSPVVFREDMETVENEGFPASSPSFPRVGPILNGHTNTFSVAHNVSCSSAGTEQCLDKTAVAPSRFAQAVALAVQRSRLQRLGLGRSSAPRASERPNGTLPSPSRSSYQYGA